MSLVRRRLLVAFAFLMVACGGGGSGSDGASGQSFLLRWRSSPDAAGYVVHWGVESGVYLDAVDVGAPAPDADGVTSFVLEYPGPTGVIYFALTSYDDAYQMSAFSNEIAVPVR